MKTDKLQRAKVRRAVLKRLKESTEPGKVYGSRQSQQRPCHTESGGPL